MRSRLRQSSTIAGMLHEVRVHVERIVPKEAVASTRYHSHLHFISCFPSSTFPFAFAPFYLLWLSTHVTECVRSYGRIDSAPCCYCCYRTTWSLPAVYAASNQRYSDIPIFAIVEKHLQQQR